MRQTSDSQPASKQLAGHTTVQQDTRHDHIGEVLAAGALDKNSR